MEKSKIDKMFPGLKEEMMMEESIASAELASEPSVKVSKEKKCECKEGASDICKACHLPPNLTLESTEMEEWRMDLFREFTLKFGHINFGKFESDKWETQDILDFIKKAISSHSQKLVSELKEVLKKSSPYTTFRKSGSLSKEEIRIELENIINNS